MFKKNNNRKFNEDDIFNSEDEKDRVHNLKYSVNPKKRLLSSQDLLNGLDSNVRDSSKRQFGTFTNSHYSSSNSYINYSENRPKYSLEFEDEFKTSKNNNYNSSFNNSFNNNGFNNNNSNNNNNINNKNNFFGRNDDIDFNYQSSRTLTFHTEPIKKATTTKPQHPGFQKATTKLSTQNNSNNYNNNNNNKSFDPFDPFDEDNNKSKSKNIIVEEDLDFELDDSDFNFETKNTVNNTVSNNLNNNSNITIINNNLNSSSQPKSQINGRKKNEEMNKLFDELIESYKTTGPTQKTSDINASSFINNNNNNNNKLNNNDIQITNEEINEKIKSETFKRIATGLKNSISHLYCSEHQESKLFDVPNDLPQVLSDVLKGMGYSKLYSHQLECREKVNMGDDIIITTPTSSGKTLCLFLPIFETIIKSKLNNSIINNNYKPTAMFLFPLNALANDQMNSINKLNQSLPEPLRLNINSFSKDTPKDYLSKLFQIGNRERPDIILTSPDWLHYQLYRGGTNRFHEEGWKRWFINLRFIVLDEIHTYSGAMGCHFINLIRRIQNYHLNLNLKFNYNQRLQFLMASATVGNPIQIAKKTISREGDEDINRLHLINKNGSGSFEKVFITLKPTKNPLTLPIDIINNWLQNNIKGIVFFNTIKSLNTLYESFTTDVRYSQKSKLVRPYYSSLPNIHKKETLEKLKNGQVNIILSTNALEAGVNISELDACLIIGYPGSKMSWKQRIGRVGRSKMGLVMYIPDNYSPLDKFFSVNPMSLYEGEPENLSFNGDFPNILRSHILCASSEIGIEANYNQLIKLFSSNAGPIIKELLETKSIKEENYLNKTKVWKSNEYHHLSVSLRGGSGANDVVNVKLNSNGKIIEKLTKAQAITRLFPGSIFMTHNLEGSPITYHEVMELNLIDTNSTSESYAIVKPIQFPKSVRIVTNANKTTSVEMKQILKQTTFSLPKYNNVQLLVSFGVGIYRTSVGSFEKKTYNNISNMNDDKYSKAEIEQITLKNSLEFNFEAPCIEFSYTNLTRDILKPTFNKAIEDLKNKLQSSLIIDRKEYESKILDLMEMGDSRVSLHTIIHQILSAIPLVLSPKNDIEESLNLPSTNLNSSHLNINDLSSMMSQNSMFLVDSVEGGTGSCEEVFDNMASIIKKSFGIPSCQNCYENAEKGIHLAELGCICCIHQNHCKNKGLLKCLGLNNLNS
ncbi:hypothetical protein DICPUDRAFT_79136 [Dictyostelium purpureum]|uniref:DEAD/DEAH box helicase n=1 Tax=Dictyostelium purpureum TaxID=5786 RepID=F0ZLP0_DICPU|nr:uncharacterized protein DICPUDRAFT_79136 [Dictyostelium purpureum]EGC35134.1 hypothetical protein DICPUDRAFT_79136 [Dictyostelium purpureum]|eukprot:XP_003288327.1 hypothetical protein DICPUDRAFT_79136 [Dictyostelium purpureum]